MQGNVTYEGVGLGTLFVRSGVDISDYTLRDIEHSNLEVCRGELLEEIKFIQSVVIDYAAPAEMGEYQGFDILPIQCQTHGVSCMQPTFIKMSPDASWFFSETPD